MIRYQLRCSENHEFDAWFRDSSAFDKQAAKGQVMCPICGDTNIVKAPMAPAVPKKTNLPSKSEVRAQQVAEQILRAADKIRDKVERDFDYVGDQFADEARRIHYGDADDRGIYGEATVDQAVELDEEGIKILPLPGRLKKNPKKKPKKSEN